MYTATYRYKYIQEYIAIHISFRSVVRLTVLKVCIAHLLPSFLLPFIFVYSIPTVLQPLLGMTVTALPELLLQLAICQISAD